MNTPTPLLPSELYVPTQDERTMATLAHALQLVGGWIAPLIIFFTKRDSKFVSFHALQVLLLHIAYVCVWIVCAVIFAVGMVATIAGSAAQGNHQNPPFGFFIFFPFIWLTIMAGWLVLLVTAIVYAIKANHGEWAEIPLVGKWAKHILHI